MTMIAWALLSILAAPAFDEPPDNLKAFPPAGEGMVRRVLRLPAREDESSFRVELLVGRTVELDARNRYFFGGKLESETIQGWGFTRYTLAGLGPMAGTRIAVAPDAPKVPRFVTLGGEPFWIRYNSRVPVVVYVPEGVEVRYRVWSAGPEAGPVEEG